MQTNTFSKRQKFRQNVFLYYGSKNFGRNIKNSLCTYQKISKMDVPQIFKTHFSWNAITNCFNQTPPLVFIQKLLVTPIISSIFVTLSCMFQKFSDILAAKILITPSLQSSKKPTYKWLSFQLLSFSGSV